jgi:glycosyltransferase involved in cell wall biosynthesis
LKPWLLDNATRFEAVIVDGLWQYNGFAVWQALRKTATPYFVFTHGMLDPWFKRRYPLKHLKKWLYWPWGQYRVLRDARGVLFTCEEERLQAKLSFPLYQAREIVVSYGTPGPPLGSDPDAQREAFLKAFPQLRNQRFLLCLSRIHPKKGCDLLIGAFNRVARREPDMNLVFAGPDPDSLREGLMAAASDLDPGRVIWTGMIVDDMKWGAFRAAEAFVLPSHQENFGIAVVEAMACGTPVLISDRVNIWREIVAGGAGLVEPDNEAGATQLIRRWLAMPDAARHSMAVAATEVFHRHFHIDIATQRLHEALAGALSGSPPSLQSQFAA